MFKVNWNLTPEATRQDCLVGSIEIAGGGGTIAEEGVYVDSWLACLIKALDSQGDASIDIPEESVPLRVSVNGPDIALSFRNRRVTGTIESLRTALASSVREFLKATRTIPDGGYPNPLAPAFDDFVGEPQGVTRPPRMGAV